MASFVEPEVTLQKFRQELKNWLANSNHKKRGWVLLGVEESVPVVEVGFLARLATNTGSTFLPAMVCAVHLSYDNYDLWPPSLTFIDPFTRQPAKPHVQAIMSTPEGPRNALIDLHPITKRPFLCLPGVREYHSHPQHTGDDWLLHRPLQEGSLINICERIWRFMVKNVLGFHMNFQGLPTWPLKAELSLGIAQGEVLDPGLLAALQGETSPEPKGGEV